MTFFQSKSIRFKSIICVFLLVVFTLLTYRDALNNGFTTWDVDDYVTNNPHIKGLTWAHLTWMFTAFYAANWHPLTWLSHAIDYAWFGLQPWGHHLTSILIHSVNVVLVFILSVRLLTVNVSRTKLISTIDHEHKILLAASVSALLFGIHPQHVESVAWIAERKDVLCLFFILVTLISYLRYAFSYSRVWYMITLGSFSLALLSKPMAVTVPIILILLDIYPLRRTALTISSPDLISYRQLGLEKLPFLAFTLVSVIITILAQQSAGAIVDHDTVDLTTRLFNAFNSLIFYLAKWVMPVSLSPFYLLSTYHLTDYTVFLPVLASILITLVSGYFWYKGHYAWLITWLFYVVTLSPMLGIIQVGSQAAADRYTYLPTLPFGLLVGIGVAKFYYDSGFRRVFRVGLMAGLILLLGQLMQLTQQQTWIWKDDLTLWTYTVLYNPDDPLAQMNLGRAYFQLGNTERAIIHYRAAASLSRHRLIYINLLTALQKLQEYSELIKFYQLALQLEIDVGQAKDNIYFHIGEAYYHQGEMKAAREFLQKALNLNAHHAAAKQLLAQIKF